MPGADKMSLKAFWDSVEQRLAKFSAEELRSILRAMAQETLPHGRRAFLDKLKPGAEAVAPARQAQEQEDLLADIDDLAEELRQKSTQAGDWEEEDDWRGDYYDDEDSLGPYEEFIEPLTALFDAAEAAFDYGNLSLARAAYEKLFEQALHVEDDYGRGVRVEDLTDVDVGEARARYLRAVYETEKPARRPKVLFEQMQRVRAWLFTPHPRLDDLIQISPKPLPDQDRFFVDWIAFLRQQSGSDADTWLREAIRLSQGTAGLEELARSEGRKRPHAYLDWATALAEAGKHREALAAAQEALKTLPAKLPLRAAIADQLCAAAVRLKETDALRVGRWEAFAASPTLPRILDLWDVTPAGEERAELMQQASRHVQDYLAHPPRYRETTEMRMGEDRLDEPAWIDQSVLAHAHLLAGEWDAAREMAAREQALGWSHSSNSQGLVVSCFLVILSGKIPGPLPRNLAQLWQAALRNSAGFGFWSEADRGDKGLKRLEHLYSEHLSGVAWSEGEQEERLSWCLEVAKKRVEAIVANKHRKSYDKAAQLIAACAEVLGQRNATDKAETLIVETRNRFPRHYAFREELDRATGRTDRRR